LFSYLSRAEIFVKSAIRVFESWWALPRWQARKFYDRPIMPEIVSSILTWMLAQTKMNVAWELEIEILYESFFGRHAWLDQTKREQELHGSWYQATAWEFPQFLELAWLNENKSCIIMGTVMA
jgi:hypothetical protein